MKNTDEEALLKKLQESLDSDPDKPSHHYNLGVFLWEKGEESKEYKERAVEHFIASAKLNPSNGAAFRFLGHFYSRVSIDSQRASKCYQRAVTLNPDDFEAGEGLCGLLDEEGRDSLEVAVCREALEKSPRAFWAFRRLGYMQVHQKKWSEAVPNLQHAIRGYPTCADLWEALGLAYQRLGMFTAAIKSYGRAIELEDSRIFALVESGNILLMLGSYMKGVEQFRLALEIEPHNVAANYGLASGLLGLSKDCVNSGAFVWGASLLEEASDVAKASTCLAGNNSSSWKLHGDIQMAYSNCFPWADEGQGLGIDEDSFKTSISSWKGKRLLAAVIANRSYQRALHLTPWQANIYTDIAISLDLICSLEERSYSDLEAWQLPEKMALGGLMLEANNNEFWLVLGCLSIDNAVKQHAFIRGLQLDVSFAVAWAYLGQLYRKADQKLLARQAFDHARSIDPSLALPWAGMSIDTHAGICTPDEAYESCVRAVHILPLAEFQVGLGKLAVLTGHLLSPQVFGALQQAVQRAPHYPESHNLNGLACEARSDYQSAVAAYRKAQYAISAFARTAPKSHSSDVSVNLARSLCQAGNAHEAACECEDLKTAGLLDSMGLQIYAVALWKLGKNDLALSMARNLASNVSTMNRASGAASLGLICKLLYCISGPESAAANILKMPQDLLQSTKISSIVSVLSSLDQSNQLQYVLPSDLHLLTSHEEGTGFHSLLALVKLVRHGSEHSLGIQSAVDYLKKVLHMYPDSILTRNHLSSLLLSSKEWKTSHAAIRCVVTEPSGHPLLKGSKSAYEILGSAAVACYSNCTSKSKYSFPTCEGQCMHGVRPVQHQQKWLHQEPWNDKSRYLLVLGVLQKAREERFPQHLCVTLKRLVFGALSSEVYSKKDQSCEYQKFQLLLCASEISMQAGDYVGCINHATDASRLSFPNGDPFFAHLQLCRAYVVQEDFSSLKDEYEKCMQLKTDYQIGWISLKFIESRYKRQLQLNGVDVNFEACLEKNGSSWNMWMAIMDLVRGHSFIQDQDFLLAEQALAHGCSIGGADCCLFLCHGAICMELARQRSGSQFLLLAVSSLTRAQESSPVPLPIVSALLAQAEASLGARAKWERNLRFEWFSWPAEMRPAELYFQMHLLARQSKVVPDQFSSVESSQSPQRWIIRAIHSNPSCSRYWKVLQKLGEQE
ncbi:tetratricopeptide repeat protein SKI3 [Magnolia sinica]|uniref:tetratricopeptide repeat protein SKI3 n=1 Tax=Magnolia sinica TaxID=86752 RepID=UPI00265ABDB0|nr:tetratricopeptide repeat protein SKI3 [Magnolia sinica]